MVIFLIILFLVIIIEVLLIGFLFSEVYIKIEKLDINSRKITEISVERVKINLQIYIFKYIRIFNLKFYKNYFEILKFKIKYEKVFKAYHIEDKIDIYRKIYQFYKTIKENSVNIKLEKVKPKINSLKIDLNLSTENAIFTSFCTCFLSSFILILLKKNLLNRKYDFSKYKYKVTPYYFNNNSFKLDLETNISFSMINIIEFIYQYNKVIKKIKRAEKDKVKMKELLKRTIDGVKILNKVRYVNKRIKAINRF